jgi:purine-binding chemotaxis protein CheW
MTATRIETEPETLAELAGKYLTFSLGGDSFGLPVNRVQEIIRLPAVTPVPRMPAHVRGVVNLRGRVIPVVELRLRLGLPTTELGPRACMIVAQLRLAGGAQSPVGLIVDAVEEVLLFGANELEPAPAMAEAEPPAHILALAKFRGAVKTLLNIDPLIHSSATAATPQPPASR